MNMPSVWSPALRSHVDLSILTAFPLHVLHCFPVQPEGQEQRLGPTHFPPLMNMGIQIPGNKGMKYWSLNIWLSRWESGCCWHLVGRHRINPHKRMMGLRMSTVLRVRNPSLGQQAVEGWVDPGISPGEEVICGSWLDGQRKSHSTLFQISKS